MFKRIILALAASVSLAAPAAAVTPVQRAILLVTGVKPTISVITAGGTAFDSRVAYTGASLSMDVDATGKLTYKPNNLFLQSNTFTNAAWTQQGTMALTANAGTDPFGGNTATRLVGSGAWALTQAGPTTNNLLIGYWVKSNNGLTQKVRLVNGSVLSSDLTVTTSWQQLPFAVAGNGSGTSGLFRDVAGDAADILIYNATLATVTYETTFAQRPAGDQTITTASAYYGPRFGYDQNGVALGYDSEEARTNLVTQSQNIGDASWLTSFVAKTSNNNAAPDGTLTASLITADGSSNIHYVITPSISATSGTIYASSLFVKAGTTSLVQLTPSGAIAATNVYANFTLSGTGAGLACGSGITCGAGVTSAAMQAYANGWYRISTVWAANATASAQSILAVFLTTGAETRAPTNTSAATFYVWGGDTEVTSTNFPGPTSYTATAASTVTRAADVASITGSAFSGLGITNGGAWSLTVTPPGLYDQLGVIAEMNTTGATDVVGIAKINATANAAGKRFQGYVNTSSATQASIVTSADDTGSVYKLVMGYGTNDVALVTEGVSAGTDNTVTLPAPTKLSIGNRDGTLQCNCHIGTFNIYKPKPINSKLIRLPLLDLPRIPANDDQPERMAA